MDKIVIHGGRKLKGHVRISGSKNAALPILIASLLTDDTFVIDNVPRLADIRTTIQFLQYIGKVITQKGDRVVIEHNGVLKTSAPYDLVRKMRASVLVMGPLLARMGKVRVSLPGGCAIGARPIDIHLEGFKRLGAAITLKGGYVECRAPGGLVGNTVNFRFASVGATENLLLASVLANGRTVLKNAAREPEITDLADALNAMGARIRGAGTSTITIDGVPHLHGCRHTVIPDRIETATYLIAAAVTKGDITADHADARHLGSVIAGLKKAGLSISTQGASIRARWVRPMRPVCVKTAVYPGFPTDVQAQWIALMSLVKGSSQVEETVFENRFMHVSELQRLGADLRISGRKVHIKGVEGISGAPVMVSDLRAGAALVLAGLVAEGKTEILRIYHLDRGYELLEKKLKSLGARIRRVPV